MQRRTFLASLAAFFGLGGVVKAEKKEAVASPKILSCDIRHTDTVDEKGYGVRQTVGSFYFGIGTMATPSERLRGCAVAALRLAPPLPGYQRTNCKTAMYHGFIRIECTDREIT